MKIDIELTKEEKQIEAILTKWFKDPIDKPCPYCEAMKEVGELIQQAKEETAREMIEWGNEPCPHQFYANTKQQCRACWDELRDKVFDKPSNPNT